MNYVNKIQELNQQDLRLMARYTGHMLLVASEHMDEGNIVNMMMNQLNPFYIAMCMDNAGVEYFDMPER